MKILDPDDPDRLRQQRLCLIGLRGAGKSTLGKILSQELSLPFIELNREIEEISGMPATEVMALYASATAIMREIRGISSPAIPSG